MSTRLQNVVPLIIAAYVCIFAKDTQHCFFFPSFFSLSTSSVSFKKNGEQKADDHVVEFTATYIRYIYSQKSVLARVRTYTRVYLPTRNGMYSGMSGTSMVCDGDVCKRRLRIVLYEPSIY